MRNRQPAPAPLDQVGAGCPQTVSNQHTCCGKSAITRLLSVFLLGNRGALTALVQRHFGFTFVLTFCILPLQSATLERLSLDDMILKSTAIVRGTVSRSYTTAQGPLIYTHYVVQVSEQFKGSAQKTVDFVVPGGVANGFRQTFPGTPQFQTGDNYVFFLWTGKSGLTHIVGLTQGLFAISAAGAADATVTRAASKELILEPGTGRQVKDQTLVMSLSALRTQIANTLQGSGK